MTNEEALDLLEHGDWFQAVYNNLQERTADKIAEAINTVAKTVRFNFTDGPLTLDQLQEMDGKPVWTELIKPTRGKSEGWSIVYKDNGSAAVQRWTTWTLWYEEYGKTWTAYAYPPAHIDRKA